MLYVSVQVLVVVHKCLVGSNVPELLEGFRLRLRETLDVHLSSPSA